jgi:atypical dual specificity phosphatase
MLVGFPASGKTSFSKTLEDQIYNIARINQDEIREKGKCEELYGKAIKKGNIVILDRCNPTKKDRKYWTNLSMGKDIICIYFSASSEECIWRIKNRTNHPTVKSGQGTTIIKSLINTMETPSINEGFKEIINIESFKECNNLLLKIGCNINHLKEENYDHIIKFVRTKHLLNLGSATRDDLLLDKDEANVFLNTEIWLEEKIDGANMGISIKDYKLVVQNRSHYVDSSYHSQFKLLDNWINDHSEDLWVILEDESKILYGEWVYALHSIHYKSLPDYFIAFDIYDINERRFYSRERLEKVLENTSINIIPIVKKSVFKSISEIGDLVNSKSQFYDGPIEGLYIRKCNNKWLEHRAKIVRSNFLSGNQHWSKNILTKNILK